MNVAPWRQYPWLLGLLLAPLLFGSVNPEGQAVVGLLFAASLILLASELGGHSVPVIPACWRWLAAILVVFPLVPLPPTLVAFLSHPRAALGQEFTLDLDTASAWLPLTLAPGETIQRAWELLLIITCFCLSRSATAQPGFSRHLTLWVSVALLLLAASDVWYRLNGQTSMLGLWEPAWGKGAGTFANRNHFANWCCVALLFTAGWIIRVWHPLHSARPQPLPDANRSRTEALFLLIAVLSGLVMAVASGSRGGLLALVAGLIVWVVMLGQRSRSRKRWFVISLLVIGAFVAGVMAGELVLERFAHLRSELATRYFKIDIWRNSLAIFANFPLFGVGWGGFATAFTLFKSFGGGSTFWHAENDYVQLLVETGLAGFIVFGFILFRLARNSFLFAWPRSSKMAEPELVFGALAALAAFATHALYEFVFQIPATALLAAALLGFVIGCHDQATRPALPAPPSNRRVLLNLGWAAVLLAVSICQGMAFLHWHRAKTALRAKATSIAATELRRSLLIWPWSMHRQLVLTRLEVALLASKPPGEQLESAAAVRARINRAIAWNPYDWELRLERAWLDLGFSTHHERARAEAWEAVKLNPQQPQIPLRFARHLADRDPDAAWQFLLSVDRSGPQHLREVLQLAWRIRGDTAVLWSLVPDTPDGLLALGDFAAGQKLLPLAAQSYQRLTNRVEAATLAERFLQIQRPDLALSVLPSAPRTSRELLLLARSHIQNADYVQAIRFAESVWRTEPKGKLLESSIKPINTSLDTLLERWRAQPTNARYGEELAEAICQQPAPQRDLGLLRQLAAKFPANLHLAWLVFQTERDTDQFQAAAQTALSLAARVAAKD